MWFRIHRCQSDGLGRPASTKPKQCSKRFHWLGLHRSNRRKPYVILTPLRHSSARVCPALPPPSIDSAFSPPRRIRCGITATSSVLHLPTPTAVKRRPTATSSSLFDNKLSKMRRLSRALEHFNPIYDDVYGDPSEQIEDEAIYEEIAPPKRQALASPASYLDLMQVSAVADGSPHKRLRSISPTPSQSIYALHGGDWVSVESGIYDAVASSSDGELDREFDADAGIYDWTVINGALDIPWPTAAYGKWTSIKSPSDLRWMHRESFII